MYIFKFFTGLITAAGVLTCGFFSSHTNIIPEVCAYAETSDFYDIGSETDDTFITDGPAITSGAAVVMDINSGTVLYSKNALESEQPSSLTKLITAYVCLNELETSSLITCSQTAASQDFPTAANAGYLSGSTFSVNDAIKGSLIASAEDCTYSLCEKAGGSMSGFATLMNSYGEQLGFLNSYFVNGLGKYEEGQTSCAYDLAIAASALMKNFPELSAVLGSKSLELSGDKTVTNSHRFINGKDSYIYAYAGKTGGTAYGGDGTWALCTYASYKGLNLVCIILDAPENDTTYEDTKKLFDYAFESYEALSVSSLISAGTSEIGTLFSDCEAFDVSDYKSIYIDEAASIILPATADTALITHEISLNQIYEYSYGDNVIGSVDFYYDGEYAGSTDILFYTENASMQASEFAEYFPSFLISPENADTSDFIYTSKVTVQTTDNSLITKIKAGIYNLYTPAKSFAAICSLLIFIIGSIIIILVLPVKHSPKDKLYTKQYKNEKISLPEDELSEVRYVRPEEFSDMQEINITSSPRGK